MTIVEFVVLREDGSVNTEPYWTHGFWAKDRGGYVNYILNKVMKDAKRRWPDRSYGFAYQNCPVLAGIVYSEDD